MRRLGLNAVVACALAHVSVCLGDLPAISPVQSPRPIAFTGFWENDGASTNGLNYSDRDYTAGIGLAFQWQGETTDRFMGALPSFSNEFAPRQGVSYAGGVVGSMRMYTPGDLNTSEPLFDDRPYAGWTYLGLIGQRANRDLDTPTFEHWELDLGTIGKDSQAGKVQTWIHKNFDSENIPRGWEHQIEDDFGVDLKYLRQWRFDLGFCHTLADAEMQVIPEIGATLGTFHTNARVGATFRIGWNLPDDFGPTRLDYLRDFTGETVSSQHFDDIWDVLKPSGGYFFIRPTGRAVAHDSTIDGSLFQESEVEGNSQTFVAEFASGFAIQFFRNWEFAYVITTNSPEFQGEGEWHTYASVILRGNFTW